MKSLQETKLFTPHYETLPDTDRHSASCPFWVNTSTTLHVINRAPLEVISKVQMVISYEDSQELKTLEESLWKTEVRFDQEKMNGILAPDFFEYGRSGRFYTREDTLALPSQQIHATIPLIEFEARLIDLDVAQLTYISVVDYPEGEERALRSSLWSRTDGRWQLRFHQGTPLYGHA
jgi:hypothetical protein